MSGRQQNNAGNISSWMPELRPWETRVMEKKKLPLISSDCFVIRFLQVKFIPKETISLKRLQIGGPNIDTGIGAFSSFHLSSLNTVRFPRTPVVQNLWKPGIEYCPFLRSFRKWKARNPFINLTDTSSTIWPWLLTPTHICICMRAMFWFRWVVNLPFFAIVFYYVAFEARPLCPNKRCQSM